MDEIAVRIVATDRGIDPKQILHRLLRDRDLAKSSRLDHLVETNGCFATLARACRTAGDHELTEWWSEQRCASEWRGSLEAPLVRPDGQATLNADVQPDIEPCRAASEVAWAFNHNIEAVESARRSLSDATSLCCPRRPG